MKTPLILASALLMLVPPVASQEPRQGQMMYCDDAGCAWVADPDPDPTQQVPADPGASPWPVDPYTGQALPPPEIGSQPVVIYGYSPLGIPALRDMKPPMPMCALSPGQALALFSAGVATQDINKVLSAYDWTTLTDAQVDPLVARLGAITPGSWQRRYMEASFDADFSTTTHEQSVRWISAPADPGHAFDLVQKSACWFVRYATT